MVIDWVDVNASTPKAPEVLSVLGYKSVVPTERVSSIKGRTSQSKLIFYGVRELTKRVRRKQIPVQEPKHELSKSTRVGSSETLLGLGS